MRNNKKLRFTAKVKLKAKCVIGEHKTHGSCLFSQNVPRARKELSHLNRFSTPLGKLNCVKRVVMTLMQPPKMTKGNSMQYFLFYFNTTQVRVYFFKITNLYVPVCYLFLKYHKNNNFTLI